jgi:uncharacterized protein (TIGR00369 family)
MNSTWLQKMLDAYEFHHILKIQVVDVADRHSVRLRLPFSPGYALVSATGNYHGGVLASLADVAGTLACIVYGAKPFTTMQMSIDFLESPRCCDLYASARVIKSWGKVSVADVEITDEADTVYAVSRGSWSAVETVPQG